MKNNILGMHHVTAMTSSAEKNYQFFTEILGMRLVKKTVNQDDIQTYHTFFADDVGTPGTDMTFFDFPGIAKGTKGTNRISKTSFRVASNAALNYWQDRLDEFDVPHSEIEQVLGAYTLSFVDFDDQEYQLISDEGQSGVAPGIPWKKGPVPAEFAIVGLGPVEISVAYFDVMKQWLTNILGYQQIKKENNAYLFEVGEGGNGASLIVKDEANLPQAQQGYGEVHHLAIRVADKEALDYWIEKIQTMNLPSSGFVDRFYFKSLYVRIGHILFEFATDGPGFMVDEPYESMGESLSLPPFLEDQRAEIEAAISPFDTTRGQK